MDSTIMTNCLQVAGLRDWEFRKHKLIGNDILLSLLKLMKRQRWARHGSGLQPERKNTKMISKIGLQSR